MSLTCINEGQNDGFQIIETARRICFDINVAFSKIMELKMLDSRNIEEPVVADCRDLDMQSIFFCNDRKLDDDLLNITACQGDIWAGK